MYPFQAPFIDVHTHQNPLPGVWAIHNIGIAKLRLFLSEKQGFCSVGIHPWDLTETHDWQQKILKISQMASDARVLALGETGLDKRISLDMDLQKQVFSAHIALSEKLQKPLIIHCVRAWSEVLQLRKQTRARMPWILHGFSSSLPMALDLIRCGCVPSFGSLLFMSRSRAAETLRALPAGSFFFETDDSPLRIVDVYEKAAKIRELPLEALKREIDHCFRRVFNFRPQNDDAVL